MSAMAPTFEESKWEEISDNCRAQITFKESPHEAPWQR